MSNPDELTRLKTAIDLYEREVLDDNEIYHKAPIIQNAHHMLDSSIKLLDAYRRYVPELEKYVPK
jgi:hypothetical protein